MADQLKRKQVRVYLTGDSEIQFKQLVRTIGALSEPVILTAIVAAGLQAIADNKNVMPLPLRFAIVKEDPEEQTRVEERPQSRYRK